MAFVVRWWSVQDREASCAEHGGDSDGGRMPQEIYGESCGLHRAPLSRVGIGHKVLVSSVEVYIRLFQLAETHFNL